MKYVHLTEEELGQYRERKMPPSALLAADDHLTQCGECRQSLERMEKGTAGEAALWQAVTGQVPPGSEHLSYDEMVAFAEEDWDKAGHGQVMAHLRGCAQCREDAEDLKSFRASLVTRPRPYPVPAAGKGRRSWMAPVWAGAAAALLLTAFLSYQALHRPMRPGSAVLVQLADAGGDIRLDTAGNLIAPAPFSPQDTALITDALQHKRVKGSAALSQLVSAPGTLLGEPGISPSFALIAPVGTAVPGDKPAFRWQAVPDATGYVLSIYDAQFRKVAESPRVLEPRWEPERPLDRGLLYTWQVTAFVKGKALRAPVPPTPEARFRVLSADEAEQLDQARHVHADSHLLLGLLYAQAGVLDDAERELTALVAANPDSGVARELLASLRQLRQRPRG